MAAGREPYELRGSRTVLKEPRCEIPQATHLVVVVKGTHAQAEAIREACWTFLEGTLNLTLNNMEKTPITHVNDGVLPRSPHHSQAGTTRSSATGHDDSMGEVPGLHGQAWQGTVW